MEEKIQFVIPFVDGEDEQWQRAFKAAGGVVDDSFEHGTSRYADEGTLFLLLKSIKIFAPWAEPVLIVAMESQVPDYVNRDEVKIICHSDFVPGGKPLFNSNSIEALMGLMPLSKRFVWLNDDIVFLNPVKESDFFRDGHPCYILNYIPLLCCPEVVEPSLPVRARSVEINGGPNGTFAITQHGPLSYDRRACKLFFSNHREELLSSIFDTGRALGQINQYAYAVYQQMYFGIYQQALEGRSGMPKQITTQKWCCLNSGCGIDMEAALAKINAYLDYRMLWK